MIQWLQRTLTSSTTGAPSTKRLVFMVAAVSLVVCLLILTGACARWIVGSGDLGTGAVGALLGIAASVAALAGVGYKKSEVGAAAPSAPDGTPNRNATGGVVPVDRGTHQGGEA